MELRRVELPAPAKCPECGAVNQSSRCFCWLCGFILDAYSPTTENPMEPEPVSGMDAPEISETSVAVSDEPTAEEKQGCADALEQLLLEVQRDEADWELSNRLDWLRLHGA
jgi:rubredoxin